MSKVSALGVSAGLAPALLLSSLLGAGVVHAAGGAAQPRALGASVTTDAAASAIASGDPDVLVRKGVRIEFSGMPVERAGATPGELREGDHAAITFRITGAEDGRPVRGNFPGVWLDIAKAWAGRGTGAMSCKDRVSLYLQGTVGMRPMVDLNSYFILVMNEGPDITVIDPYVGVTGITNLFATIRLERPPADWVKTRDEQRLFVSMPLAGKVAVADLQKFKVNASVPVGPNPVRVALQPDERYLWVGNDGKRGTPGGVTVVDTGTLRVVAEIPTGEGHHEIAFSSDDRYAYVSNRDDGTVSVIDIRRLVKVKDLRTGGVPISLAFSPLSQALYVADGRTGVVTVVRGDEHEVVAKIQVAPGLGPLRFSEEGRFGLVVNTAEDAVYVIDAATDEIKHVIPVDDQPYQVAFTREFAHVRSLGSERVSMINLADLLNEKARPPASFPAGANPPMRAGQVSIADAIVQTADDAAVLVVSPADATVYYYMEGMNAPMGAFRNYGQRPRAVAITDRSLHEKEPGVYTSTVKLPAAGTYDVAFMLETPEILHCFTMTVAPDPDKPGEAGPLAVEYLERDDVVRAGEPHRLRFRLSDPANGEPLGGIGDVSVAYFRAPASKRSVVAAKEIASAVYEAVLPIPRTGAYFAYVGVPSRGVKYGDIPFITLRTERAGVSRVARKGPAGAPGTAGGATPPAGR